MGSATVCIKNVERLISRCEDILGEKTKIRGQQWRIVKYVESLSEKINELNTVYSACISADQLETFKQRLVILQEVTRDLTKNHSPTDKTNNENIPPTGSYGYHDDTMTTPTQQRSLSNDDMKGSGLLRRSMARNFQTIREELFNRQDSLSASSKGVDSSLTTAALEDHQREQERIAQDMIEIAKSLKHRSLAARDIIRTDTKVLEQTTELADRNISGLERETDRLKEKTKGCSCTIWILLIIVFIVFIQMVVFIRFFPKRRV